jgi:hypothetical protein
MQGPKSNNGFIYGKTPSELKTHERRHALGQHILGHSGQLGRVALHEKYQNQVLAN